LLIEPGVVVPGVMPVPVVAEGGQFAFEAAVGEAAFDEAPGDNASPVVPVPSTQGLISGRVPGVGVGVPGVAVAGGVAVGAAVCEVPAPAPLST
jgi:hypothetical protein